jgi:hypothetical protein
MLKGYLTFVPTGGKAAELLGLSGKAASWTGFVNVA